MGRPGHAISNNVIDERNFMSSGAPRISRRVRPSFASMSYLGHESKISIFIVAITPSEPLGRLQFSVRRHSWWLSSRVRGSFWRSGDERYGLSDACRHFDVQRVIARGTSKQQTPLGWCPCPNCRAWLEEDDNKRVVLNDVDGTIIYHLCVQASPRIVKVSGFNIYPRPWWQH